VHEGERRVGAPTVILLHGLGATAALNWYTSFPALAARYHVVAPDLRGHGRGIRARIPFTLEDAADDVAALADSLEIERFVPVGYSMGGPIAQLLWRRHRDRVAGLVLCATASTFRATPREHVMFAALPALGQMNRIVPDAFSRRLIAQIPRSYLAATGFRDWAQSELLRRDPRAVLQAAIELGKYSGKDWVGEIDVPTSVVIHARDQIVPARRQLALASSVPGATTHVVDADHFAVIRERERFVDTLVRAIDQVVLHPGTASRHAA
jgi:pimeloyl-ACP methyl ester carboxylesterase